MRHRPHVFVPEDWTDHLITVAPATELHLRRSLRLQAGASVSYTDGDGRTGEGVWTGAAIERGAETLVPASKPAVTIAVAPPTSKDRQRFIVEKLQELGVAELQWMRTQHGEGRAPRPDRAEAWAIGALEQSRGAYLIALSSADLSEVAGIGAVACAPGGELSIEDCRNPDRVVVAVGPEGGFSEAELAQFGRVASLGPTVLRTETAAIVAAARVVG